MMKITAWIKRKYPLIVAVVLLASLSCLLFVRLDPQRRDYIEGIDTEVFTVQGGWGYQVLVNGEVYIYQPFVPGNNKNPFPSEKSARKAARMVESKMRSGATPNLSREELEEAGAFDI